MVFAHISKRQEITLLFLKDFLLKHVVLKIIFFPTIKKLLLQCIKVFVQRNFLQQFVEGIQLILQCTYLETVR